jgi:hypothetical protein
VITTTPTELGGDDGWIYEPPNCWPQRHWLLTLRILDPDRRPIVDLRRALWHTNILRSAYFTICFCTYPIVALSHVSLAARQGSHHTLGRYKPHCTSLWKIEEMLKGHNLLNGSRLGLRIWILYELIPVLSPRLVNYEKSAKTTIWMPLKSWRVSYFINFQYHFHGLYCTSGKNSINFPNEGKLELEISVNFRQRYNSWTLQLWPPRLVHVLARQLLREGFQHWMC